MHPTVATILGTRTRLLVERRVSNKKKRKRKRKKKKTNTTKKKKNKNKNKKVVIFFVYRVTKTNKWMNPQ